MTPTVAILAAAFAFAADPQSPPTEFKPDAQGQWQATAKPAPGSDEELVARARQALAEDRPTDAYAIIDPWLTANERGNSPFLPQAYIIRGDAMSLDGDEFNALYDYEKVIKQFAGTPEYVTAIERELELAVRYVNGLERKFFGMRILDASDVGIELLIRTQERLPGSRLAERAGIELADYYYRAREMELAGESYQLFLENFPQSQYRMHAMQRRIYASLARFKGPQYDTSPLLDAQVNIRRFQSLYPAEAEKAGVDDALLTRIDESGAQHLLEVARYYENRGDPVAMRYELRRLIALHPQTAAASEALRIMQDRGWVDSRETTPVGGERFDEFASPKSEPKPEAKP
jgi:tetratricopeptide (TPR) repeat protein